MAKRFHDRAYRRDINTRKYISRLKENAYWLCSTLDENWTTLVKNSKFAKRLKNGGSPVRRYSFAKKYHQYLTKFKLAKKKPYDDGVE